MRMHPLPAHGQYLTYRVTMDDFNKLVLHLGGVLERQHRAGIPSAENSKIGFGDAWPGSEFGKWSKKTDRETSITFLICHRALNPPMGHIKLVKTDWHS